MNIVEMKKRLKNLEAANRFNEMDDLVDKIASMEHRGKWNKHASVRHDVFEENYA